MRLLVLLVAVASACSTVAPSPAGPGTARSLTCGDPARVRAGFGELDRQALEALALQYLRECATAEIITLTQKLVSFRTISSQYSWKDGAPFVEMAAYLRQRAEAAGLAFNVVGENDAWEITLGDGPRSVAFVTHADVVPVTSDPASEGAALPAGWMHPPFDAEVVGDRLYGRGTEDDKGAIAGAIVALETFQRMGLAPRGTLVLVMGTAEEEDWEGMQRYAKQMPATRFVVSVDASFPVIFGESGFVAWNLGLPLGDTKPHAELARAIAVRGGEFLTQVPAEAQLQLVPGGAESLAALEARVRGVVDTEKTRRASERFDFTVAQDPACACVVLTARGESVHSSLAETGRNALWALAGAARALSLAPNGIAGMLDLIGRELDGDHWGERLGLGHEHPVMGKLLVAPTVLRVVDGDVRLGVNMRRPKGPSREEFQAKLEATLARLQAATPGLRDAGEGYVGQPVMVEPDSPLVSTLMAIYREVTGDTKSAPSTMRGGTYARLFEGAVNFGPAFPDKPYRGHAADEYIEIGSLAQMAEMLARSFLKLDAMD